MKLYSGTSGYSYSQWKGPFYPKNLPSKEMLRYYSERFNAVEINNTFYRMPSLKLLNSWASQTPDGFKFVIKASRQITHVKRLKDQEDPVRYLFKMCSSLDTRLGAVLFQLPPNLEKDLPRLSSFLDILPKPWKCAFEFRHESWLSDDVFALLKDRNVALCIAEAENDLRIPFISTADFGYLRLRLPLYDDASLRDKAAFVASQSWQEAFIFFKHENEATGPQFARRFLDLAA